MADTSRSLVSKAGCMLGAILKAQRGLHTALRGFGRPQTTDEENCVQLHAEAAPPSHAAATFCSTLSALPEPELHRTGTALQLSEASYMTASSSVPAVDDDSSNDLGSGSSRGCSGCGAISGSDACREQLLGCMPQVLPCRSEAATGSAVPPFVDDSARATPEGVTPAGSAAAIDAAAAICKSAARGSPSKAQASSGGKEHPVQRPALEVTPGEVASSLRSQRAAEANGFAFGELAGCGGFAQVRKASVLVRGGKAGTERRRVSVAIKVPCSPAAEHDGIARAIHNNELHALRQLRTCPGVVRLLATVTWAAEVHPPPTAPGVRLLPRDATLGQAPLLVMELADGDVHSLIKGGPLRSRRLSRDMLAALASMHARQWAHLDVKPENFLLVGGGAGVVVGDLGMAQYCPMRRVSGRCGTKGYAAPEVEASGGGEGKGEGRSEACRRKYDPFAADVWSFGETLLAQWCGRLWVPQDGVRGWTLAGWTAEVGPAAAAAVPPLLASLLERLLRVRPSERMTAAEALRHPFFAGLVAGAVGRPYGSDGDAGCGVAAQVERAVELPATVEVLAAMVVVPKQDETGATKACNAIQPNKKKVQQRSKRVGSVATCQEEVAATVPPACRRLRWNLLSGCLGAGMGTATVA